MESNKECPICGCKKIVQGKQKGAYARMYPLEAISYIGGSDIIADICANCGYILSMRVEKPEKFK